MNVRYATILLLLASVLACPGAREQAAISPAKPAPTPEPSANEAPAASLTGSQVLDRYIEVTGGRAAYEKIRNRQISGKMEIPAMSMSGPFSLWQSLPNKGYLEADVDGVGLLQTGTDGSIVWEQTMMTGPRILVGPERAITLRTLALHADLNWRDHYPKAEFAGEETVEGRKANKVILTPEVGKPVTSYYDVESGLLIKTSMIMQSQMGEVPTETFVEDYRDVGGILFPHRSRQKIMTIEQVMIFDTVRHNVDMPTDRFTLPEEVAALAEK